MQRNLVKLCIASVLLINGSDASRIHEMKRAQPLKLAESQSAALAAAGFKIDPATGNLVNENVSADFQTVMAVLGADLKTTWDKSPNAETSSVWKYFGKIDAGVQSVLSSLGLGSGAQASSQPTMKDYFIGLKQVIQDSFAAANLTTQATSSASLTTLQDGLKLSEAREYDVLQELVERLRFTTQQVASIEVALGAGYINGPGQAYSGHSTVEFPNKLPTVAAEMSEDVDNKSNNQQAKPSQSNPWV